MRVKVIFINQNQQILLGKDSRYSTWNIPGGGMAQNEHPVDTACREIKEEIGYDLESLEFFKDVDQYKVYLARISDEIKFDVSMDPDKEFVELLWVDLDKLELYNIYEPIESILLEYKKSLSSIADHAKIMNELVSKYFYDIKYLPKLAVFKKPSDGVLAETKLDENVIVFNPSVLNDSSLFRQVLAHELIHAYLHLKYGKGVAKHGEMFQNMATIINAKEGDDYVAAYADETKT